MNNVIPFKIADNNVSDLTARMDKEFKKLIEEKGEYKIIAEGQYLTLRVSLTPTVEKEEINEIPAFHHYTIMLLSFITETFTGNESEFLIYKNEFIVMFIAFINKYYKEYPMTGFILAINEDTQKAVSMTYIHRFDDNYVIQFELTR